MTLRALCLLSVFFCLPGLVPEAFAQNPADVDVLIESSWNSGQTPTEAYEPFRIEITGPGGAWALLVVDLSLVKDEESNININGLWAAFPWTQPAPSINPANTAIASLLHPGSNHENLEVPLGHVYAQLAATFEPGVLETIGQPMTYPDGQQQPASLSEVSIPWTTENLTWDANVDSTEGSIQNLWKSSLFVFDDGGQSHSNQDEYSPYELAVGIALREAGGAAALNAFVNASIPNSDSTVGEALIAGELWCHITIQLICPWVVNPPPPVMPVSEGQYTLKPNIPAGTFLKIARRRVIFFRVGNAPVMVQHHDLQWNGKPVDWFAAANGFLIPMNSAFGAQMVFSFGGNNYTAAGYPRGGYHVFFAAPQGVTLPVDGTVRVLGLSTPLGTLLDVPFCEAAEITVTAELPALIW